MKFTEHNGILIDQDVKVEYSSYTSAVGAEEYQLMFHPSATDALFDDQLSSILKTYKEVRATGLPQAVPVFMRFFVSDAANQSSLLYRCLGFSPSCAVSVVEQAPLDGAKVTLWVYLQNGIEVTPLPNGLYATTRGNYTHYWSGTAFSTEGNSEEQTYLLLQNYIHQLEQVNCKLADQCIRTWFFVQNVDVNYAGVVKARNKVFSTQGLTAKTHFISSTGINGRNADYHALVQLDTYAVKGLQPEQIQFLYAPTHLNPTYEYGVSFERGTAVHYADRSQVFISGTASIDNKGEVLYLGNIRQQVARMWENVDALLQEANCNFNNVQQMIIYLRDVTDYAVVRDLYEERFPHTPKVIVYAPVCRPGWLIEMECIAVRDNNNMSYAPF